MRQARVPKLTDGDIEVLLADDKWQIHWYGLGELREIEGEGRKRFLKLWNLREKKKPTQRWHKYGLQAVVYFNQDNNFLITKG